MDSAGARKVPVICWDRRRPAATRRERAVVLTSSFLNFISRFALIAGGTPAVPQERIRSQRTLWATAVLEE
jgi:hypothetical protein